MKSYIVRFTITSYVEVQVEAASQEAAKQEAAAGIDEGVTIDTFIDSVDFVIEHNKAEARP